MKPVLPVLPTASCDPPHPPPASSLLQPQPQPQKPQGETDLTDRQDAAKTANTALDDSQASEEQAQGQEEQSATSAFIQQQEVAESCAAPPAQSKASNESHESKEPKEPEVAVDFKPQMLDSLEKKSVGIGNQTPSTPSQGSSEGLGRKGGVVHSLKESMDFWDYCLGELEDKGQLFDLVSAMEKDTMSTSFSGVDAPRVALNALHWRLEERLSTEIPKTKQLFMVEWSPESQEELKLFDSDSHVCKEERPCLFSDISEFWQDDLKPIVEQLKDKPTMSVEILAGRISAGTATTRVAYCHQHRRKRSLKVARRHITQQKGGWPVFGRPRGCSSTFLDLHSIGFAGAIHPSRECQGLPGLHTEAVPFSALLA